MRRNSIFLGVLIVILSLAYQNCSSPVSFSEIPTLIEKDEGGDCVPGERFGVWLDRADNGEILNENFMDYVVAFTGTKDAATNYGYDSASAHIQVGPEPKDQKLNVFMYHAPASTRLLFQWPAQDEALIYAIEISSDEVFGPDSEDPTKIFEQFETSDLQYEWVQFQQRPYYWRVIGKKPNPDYNTKHAGYKKGTEVDKRKYVNTAQPVIAATQIDLTNIDSLSDGTLQPNVTKFSLDEHSALNIFANRDGDVSLDDASTGGGHLNIQVITNGNNNADRYMLKDDPISFDLFELVSDLAAITNQYLIQTSYNDNTDGAVIGPFYGEDYKIRVKINKAGNADEGRFHSADLSSFSLAEGIAGTAFIITRAGYETCEK